VAAESCEKQFKRTESDLGQSEHEWLRNRAKSNLNEAKRIWSKANASGCRIVRKAIEMNRKRFGAKGTPVPAKSCEKRFKRTESDLGQSERQWLPNRAKSNSNKPKAIWGKANTSAGRIVQEAI
jgi:hypothetical protein